MLIEKLQYYFTDVHLQEKLVFFSKRNTDIFSVAAINFLIYFKNRIEYLSLFSSVVVLMERVTGQRVSFLFTKKTIPAFNIKENDVIGVQVTLRNSKVLSFLLFFYTYSFGKLFDVPYLFLRSKSNENISFEVGFTKLLFFSNLGCIPDDWDYFSYLFDEMVYGITVHFDTGYLNIYINRLILSHYCL